jgi:xanthine dehydrogenase YagT iron-sulfur-binding subunit
MAHDDEKHGRAAPGVSRRGFITSVGTGAIGAAAAARLGTAAPADATDGVGVAEGDLMPVTLSVNGRRCRLLVEARWSLQFVLRERLGLTGTKVGCARGECGACTVLIDGEARYSCLTLAVEADGREITTIEGLMDGEDLGPTQRAFAEEDGFQCGYCTPGQVMTAEAFLRTHPEPTLDEIRDGMAGTLCRCGAYAHIVKSVARAAEMKRGSPRPTGDAPAAQEE